MPDLADPPAPDSVAGIEAVLRRLIPAGTVAELRALHVGPRRSTHSGYFDDLTKMAQAAHRLTGQAEGVYWTLNPCDPALLARCANRTQEVGRDQPLTTDKDILRRGWLLIDCDFDRPKGISATSDEHTAAQRLARGIRKALRGEGWPEPWLADSGNGAHLLYRVDLPNDPASLELITRCLKALAQHWNDAVPGVKVDSGNFNASRICKLPGTLARKGDNTTERPHRLAQLLEGPATPEVVAAALLTALAAQCLDDPVPSRPGYSGTPGQPVDIPAFMAAHSLRAVREGTWNGGGYRWVLEACPFDPSHTDRSACLFQFASGAVDFSCRHESCGGKRWRELRALYGAPVRRPALTVPPRPVSASAEAPAADAGAPAPDPPAETIAADGRPIIRVSDEIHRVRDQVLAALDSANAAAPTMFVRGRQLVRIVEVEIGGHKQGLIEAYSADSLRPRIGEVAAIQRWNQHKKTWIATDVRREQVAAVLTADRFPFPVLAGLSEVPFMRPDGSIQFSPGYDPATRLIYQPAPGLVVPPIPDHPTAEQIAAARTLICDDLLGDFPFTGPAERAHAVACLLLPFIRSLIAGPTPMHLIESPTPGSGKSLLTEVLLRPALGAGLVGDSDKKDEDEARKWITAKVQEGAQVLWIDNIKHGIDSSTIANALTSLHWSDRLLGSTATVSGPLRAVWVATANNPTLTTEIARRVVRIRIDPKMDRPQLRTGFKHPDIRAWAAAQRGVIVGAALTLVRAWVAAGRPDGGGRLGSYEEWSAILSGILQVAGIDGFLGNLIEAYDLADTEGAQWRALIGAWWQRHGSEPVPSSQLYELVVEIDGFDFGKGRDSKGAAVAFGKALARQRDRCYGPLRVVKATDRQRLARWALVPQEGHPESVEVYFGVDLGAVRAKNDGGESASLGSTTFDSTIPATEQSTLIYTSTPPMPPVPCVACGEQLWAWVEAEAGWRCTVCDPGLLEDPPDG